MAASFYVSMLAYLLLHFCNACDVQCADPGLFYIDNVQSIGRADVILLTVGKTGSTNKFCKRMDTDDGNANVVDCADFTDDMQDWGNSDTDPTSTTITNITNNIGTVTVTMTRNAESIQVTNIPFNSTLTTSPLSGEGLTYHRYWTINSLSSTFIMFQDGLSSQNRGLFAIRFTSQSSNTYNIHSVELSGYTFGETEGNQVYVYEELNILKVPMICCLCHDHVLISYEIDTSGNDGTWMMTTEIVTYDAAVFVISEKAIWWGINCPSTVVDVYDLSITERTKEQYNPDLTDGNTYTSAPSSSPTAMNVNITSVIGICDNDCISSYDGCNSCFCDISTSDLGTACTERWCSVTSTAYCKECVSDKLYWLRTLAGGCQEEGINCDSRAIGACSKGEDRSSCKCPSQYPYFVETLDGGSGCIAGNDCPMLGQTLDSLPLEFFEYPRTESSNCDYVYTICYSDNQCEGNLICNIPDDSYSTCVPLFCNLDDNCDLIKDDNCLINDCVGQGWGYCTTDDKLFNPNGSGINLLKHSVWIVSVLVLLA